MAWINIEEGNPFPPKHEGVPISIKVKGGYKTELKGVWFGDGWLYYSTTGSATPYGEVVGWYKDEGIPTPPWVTE